MSSLAAARADNFYVKKNFNPQNVPEKKIQEKPFEITQGERVGGSKVRYQTPFHVRCQGCLNMIAKGVRFNAMKTWVGNFYSTKIYQFRMKCSHCIQRFVIRTDPQNCDYLYVSGAKRIFQTNDCTDQTRIRDQEAQKKIKQDPFSKLENQFKDKQIYGNMSQTLQKIQQNQQIRDESEIQLNRLLRKKIRSLKQDQKNQQNYKREKNIFIPLIDQKQQDNIKTEHINFKIEKFKLIKKQDKLILSERDKLKEKMKKMNSNFRNQLKKQIVSHNRPQQSIFIKK